MSNIPDITSLSDLLATSPSQPLTEQRPTNTLQIGLATTKSLNDIIENNQEKDGIIEVETHNSNNIKNIKESGTIEKNAENDHSEENIIKESIIDEDDDNNSKIDNEEEELTELLNLRSHKLQLSEERALLLKKRSELKSAIEDMKIKISVHQNKKESESTKRRLKELLENNTNEYIQNKRISNDSNSQELILKDLNVLPSQDWEHRLYLVKKFLDSIEIDKIKTYNEFNEHSELERKIEYTIISPLIFRLPIKLNIKASDDLIDNIIMDDKSILSISDISPSFYSVLTSNYLQRKKIDLIMYSLNSLSSLTNARVLLFHKLIRQFRDFIDKVRFQELIGTDELSNKIKLFSILKPIDRLDLSISYNDKAFKILLIWEIVLSEVSLGKCESNIKLQVSDGNSDLGDISTLFLKLVNEGGILNALMIIFKKCFNIDVS